MPLSEINFQMSSGEIPIADLDRVADIERKQKLIQSQLTSRQLDALLLTAPANIAWFSTGADVTRGSPYDLTAALFLNSDARVVLTRNADSQFLFEREMPSLGFQLKERAWHEDLSVLMSDLCRGRNVACDQSFDRCVDFSLPLKSLRLPLSKYEQRHLRELGATMAHCVEATARQFDRGSSESEIAGQVAHRLLRHGVQPIRLQVAADGRLKRHRHWTSSDDPVDRVCVISAIGRRRGLHAGVSRTVSFGPPPKESRDGHFSSLMVLGTALFFSQAEFELKETWQRVQRIYEKAAHGDEWHLSDQGCITGYEFCEAPIVPPSDYRLMDGTPIYWQPSIGPALTAETMLVRAEGFELITPVGNWPIANVDVKQHKIPLADILLRS